MILPPFEFLVNCGKMTFILYEVQSMFVDLKDNIVSNNYIGINLSNSRFNIILSKYESIFFFTFRIYTKLTVKTIMTM